MSHTEDQSPSLASIVRNSRCYAGIGARSTPRPFLSLIEQIAEMLASLGETLRRGRMDETLD